MHPLRALGHPQAWEQPQSLDYPQSVEVAQSLELAEVGVEKDLNTHAAESRDVDHGGPVVPSRRCRVQPCEFVYIHKDSNYRVHMMTSHPDIFTCQQCKGKYTLQEDLSIHATESGHATFLCDFSDCSKGFARLDTFQRHQRSHQEDARRFSCKYCKKYRGEDGFKRKDHLTQHLRGYHHMEKTSARADPRSYACTEQDCPEYRFVKEGWRNNFPFTKRPDYIKHMREVHETSEFPCLEPGCVRVGAKGYFRKADLRAHMKKLHNTSSATSTRSTLSSSNEVNNDADNAII